MPAGGADDPELEAAVGDEVDDRLRVVHLERDVQPRVPGEELAQEHGHDDRRRPGRGADRELARERALAVGGDLVEELLLELQQPLGATEQAQPGLGRLDPTTGAVEQLRAEPLLERPHLQRDRRLRDAQALGGLGEAAALDDLAERCKLACIHKQMLSKATHGGRDAGRANRYGRRMKVWVDMTNSPHVPFFRPLIALLEERGHEVRVSARDFAQTLELLVGSRDPPRRRRPAPRRRGPGREDPRHGLAPARSPRLGPAAALRPRALPRLARAAARRPHPRRPLRLRVRLRVRPRPAHDRLARGDAGRRARRDPAGAARPARRARRQGAPLPRPEGGVLPRAASGRTSASSASSASTASRVLVVVRTPPEVSLYHRHGNPLFTDVLERLGSDDGRAGGRAPPHAGAARAARSDRRCRRSSCRAARSTPRA